MSQQPDEGTITRTLVPGFVCTRCNHIYHNRRLVEPKELRCGRCKTHAANAIKKCDILGYDCPRCGYRWYPKDVQFEYNEITCSPCGKSRPMTAEDHEARRTVTIDGQQRIIEPEIPLEQLSH